MGFMLFFSCRKPEYNRKARVIFGGETNFPSQFNLFVEKKQFSQVFVLAIAPIIPSGSPHNKSLEWFVSIIYYKNHNLNEVRNQDVDKLLVKNKEIMLRQDMNFRPFIMNYTSDFIGNLEVMKLAIIPLPSNEYSTY